MNRRGFLGLALGGLATSAVIAIGAGRAFAAPPPVQVWKSPGCGCCDAWAEHMRAAGFAVEVTEIAAINGIKAKLGVPMALMSCHTALVDGYTLEGHVPADAVKRLLAERPRARGLAVPGMPQGSPGMETGVFEPYDIILFGAGAPSVFERR